ncbi:MAG: Ig-like domain repeat protein [Acidobacteriia bacterium]|nr:Ig-like domain repeat protein [Terriglobia bacterium]
MKFRFAVLGLFLTAMGASTLAQSPAINSNTQTLSVTPKNAMSSGTAKQSSAKVRVDLKVAVPRVSPMQQSTVSEDLRRYLQPPASRAVQGKKDALHPPPAPNSAPQAAYAPSTRLEPLPKGWAQPEHEEDTENLVRQWKQQRPSKARKASIREALAMRSSSTSPKNTALAPAEAQSPMSAPVTNAWLQVGYGNWTSYGSHYYRAGRIRQASYAYDNNQGLTTLWVGGTGGGLWRGVLLSIFGVAFVPVSDNLPGSPSVGAFLVQPGNSNNILIGSGDSYRYGGTGMYKTMDGGATWKAVSPSDGTSWPSAFQKVLIDVGDTTNQTVLASGDTGIWRSTDFGSTWTQVYNGATTDLVQDPVNTYIWYAGAPGIGVLRSTSWGSFYAPIGAGMSAPGRVAVAVSAAAPWHIYAMSASVDGNGLSVGLAGIWRSDNYGDGTWNQIEMVDNIGWGQAFHTTALSVDPTNADIVVAGMGGMEISYNATSSSPTWNYSCDGGHADQTDFIFESGTNTIISTNDGGVFAIDKYALTVSGSLNYATNLNLQQVFGAGNGDMACSYSLPDECIAGLQDDGVVTLNRNTTPAIVDSGLGGDGGQVSISPDNPNEVFAMWNGARRYAFDGGGTIPSWTDFGNCPPNVDNSNFYATTMLDQTPSNGSLRNLFTISGNFVYYKPVDSICDWSQANSYLFPLPGPFMMDASNDQNAYVFYTVPWNSGKLYVLDGYSDGPLGSMFYEDRTPPLPAGSQLKDSRIAADRSSSRPYTVTYVTSSSRPPRALLSNDRGQTWTDVTGDLSWKLPNGYFWKLVANPGDQQNLFLATDTGVYRSDNGGANWYSYAAGLPAVVFVNDIELNYDHASPPLLHIGTYGRGFWDRQVAPDSVLSGSSINPSTFVGGKKVDYVIWLDRSAPVDTTVTLSSSDPTIFPIPATVTIAAGYSNAGIVVATPAVSALHTIQVLAKYNGVTQSSVAVVTPLNPTSTVVSSSLNPSVYGQSVTFTSQTTSTVAGTLTGSVTFYDGATTLGPPVAVSGGTVSITVPRLDAAVHSLTATYSGDPNYAISTSPVLLQTVGPAATTTAIAASLNPSAYGQPVTITAAVKSPAGAVFTGSVQFNDGAAVLGTSPVSATGVATFSSVALAVGSHSLTAQYTASTDFKASTSTALAHKVVRAGTKTSLQASPNPAKKGQVVTLTAYVTPKYFGTPAGTVTFKNGTQILGTATIVSNQATFTTSTLAVGTHSLTAVYGGNAQFNKSTSAVVKEVIQ